MKFLTRLLAVFAIVIASSCGRSDITRAPGNEALSAPSPDGLGRAFVWLPQSNGSMGATVSQLTQVWLQSSKGKKGEKLILDADKTTGIRLYWNGPNELDVCYSQAQISKFRNFFVVAAPDSPDIYSVDIILRKVAKLSDCHI
jgi:hypothetical protein